MTECLIFRDASLIVEFDYEPADPTTGIMSSETYLKRVVVEDSDITQIAQTFFEDELIEALLEESGERSDQARLDFLDASLWEKTS